MKNNFETIEVVKELNESEELFQVTNPSNKNEKNCILKVDQIEFRKLLKLSNIYKKRQYKNIAQIIDKKESLVIQEKSSAFSFTESYKIIDSKNQEVGFANSAHILTSLIKLNFRSHKYEVIRRGGLQARVDLLSDGKVAAKI